VALGSRGVAVVALAVPCSVLAQQSDSVPARVYGEGFSVPVIAAFQLLVADTVSAQFPVGTIAQLGDRILVVVQPRNSFASDSALVTEEGCDRLRRGTAQQQGTEVSGHTVELTGGYGCQLVVDDNVRRMTTIAVLGDASFTVACTFDVGRDPPPACDRVLYGLELGDPPAPPAVVEPRMSIDDPPRPDQWRRIHMRMMMRQVREILGEPIKVVTTGLVAGEEWQFPGGGSVLFDRNGRVVSVMPPEERE